MKTTTNEIAGARTLAVSAKQLRAAMVARQNPPKPVLRAGVVYSGDNGARFCVHCAGMSAKYSGRDLSGHRVTPMTQADADQWKQVMDADLDCEGGCTVHKPSAGIGYSEAAARAMFDTDDYLDDAGIMRAIALEA